MKGKKSAAIDLAEVAREMQEVRGQDEAAGREKFRNDYLGPLVYREAINGDESFGPDMLQRLLMRTLWRLLDESDSAALFVILGRLLKSPAGTKVICGVPKRTGQRRRGYTGLVLAIEMSSYMREKRVSQRQAAARIGKLHSLSASAVLGHWRKNYDNLLSAHREYAKAIHPQATDAQLTALARVGMLGAKAATQDEIEAAGLLTNGPAE
jgi:hypothetical protein